MIPLHWHLGDVVRKLRLVRGYDSQEALGSAAGGLDKGTINRLETRGEEGSTPETIRRVADALAVEVGDLYAMIPAAPTAASRVEDAQTRERDHLWERFRGQGARAQALNTWRGLVAARESVPTSTDHAHTESQIPATAPRAAKTGKGKRSTRR